MAITGAYVVVDGIKTYYETNNGPHNPNGTIIAVSISDAHEVSRFCIAIGIASATAVRTKPFGNADLVMDRLLP